MKLHHALKIPVWDRGLARPCTYATSWCATHCYMRKFVQMCPKAMTTHDLALDYRWMHTTPAEFSQMFQHHDRVRVAVRGEPIAGHKDIIRLHDWTATTPNTIYMIPTRAWHDSALLPALRDLARRRNLRILCSVDPSDPPDTHKRLHVLDLSTITVYPNAEQVPRGSVPCPKTWMHGNCRDCVRGCFADDDMPRDIALQKHR